MNKRFLYPLLIHMSFVWVALNLNMLLPLLYRLHHENGIVDELSFISEKFISFNFVGSYMVHMAIWIFITVPLIELNYWYIFNKKPLFIGICTSLLLSYVLVFSTPFRIANFHGISQRGFERILLLAGYIIAYSLIRKLLQLLYRRKELQKQRIENELNVLKAQINPHFFFNSLNYVYGTALSENANKTSHLIELLSEMMRYSITNASANFVLLQDELKFINNYIYLQKVRLPKKESIKIEIDIQDDKSQYKIPPLLFLPFIENAFKYGISIDQPCLIKIEMCIIKGQLTMHIYNTITKSLDIAGNNTGIENTRKRLNLLYGNNYTLINTREKTYYTVNLKLQLQD